MGHSSSLCKSTWCSKLGKSSRCVQSVCAEGEPGIGNQYCVKQKIAAFVMFFIIFHEGDVYGIITDVFNVPFELLLDTNLVPMHIFTHGPNT